MYFDDPDFSLRAQKAGFEVHLLAQPLVYHLNFSNKLNSNAAYYYGRNPFIMIRSNFPWYYKPTAFFGQFFIRLPRNIFRCKNFSACESYFQGFFDGLVGI
jgi:GT2 family glycosyltransferase